MEPDWNLNIGLTMEQQFHSRQLQDAIDQMDKEQLQSYLKQVTELLMVKENIIKQLLKQLSYYTMPRL